MEKFAGPDFEIFARCQLHADLPVRELAKLCGRRPHVVKRALQKLLDSGRIKRVGAIDFSALGLQETLLRFSLAERDQTSRENIIRALRESQRILWLAGTGGRLQFFASILARNQHEVLEFLESLADRFGAVFSVKYLTLVAQSSFFGRRYFCPSAKVGDALELQCNPMALPPTFESHQLLAVYAKDFSASLRDVSQKLGLPLSTVQFRWKRLINDKVVVRQVFSLNTTGLLLPRYYLFVYCRGVSRNLTTTIRRVIKESPIVISMYRGIGEWDYAIRVESVHAAEVHKLQQRLLVESGGLIAEIEIIPILNVEKVVSYPIEDYNLAFGNGEDHSAHRHTSMRLVAR